MKVKHHLSQLIFKKTGTGKFYPSKEIFSTTKFSFNILEKRMRELAFLNKGISISLLDTTQKKQKSSEFKFGGIIEFVNHLDKKREKKNKNGNDLFKKPMFIEGKKTT